MEKENYKTFRILFNLKQGTFMSVALITNDNVMYRYSYTDKPRISKIDNSRDHSEFNTSFIAHGLNESYEKMIHYLDVCFRNKSLKESSAHFYIANALKNVNIINRDIDTCKLSIDDFYYLLLYTRKRNVMDLNAYNRKKLLHICEQL